ncbi:MAG: DUF1566 domain-containing protein [Deltaproteobacteria bacterium]|nr:DUF1566 domain-containing protein [Deltaproteobacteria bacterium]
MTHITRAVALFLLTAVLAGCQTKDLQGKVQNASHEPIGGLKMVAVEVKEDPSGEPVRFETVTHTDGSFWFRGLAPHTTYVLAPEPEDVTVTVRTTASTGPEGQTVVLEKPLVIRFSKDRRGILFDSKTYLEWVAGPDQDTTWEEARSWVQELSLAGGGWRMPTMEELKSLFVKGAGPRNIPLLETTGWWVWSCETSGSTAKALIFRHGSPYTSELSRSYNCRAFAVRAYR